VSRPDTRILLADDHALVRRGLRLILDHEPGLTVIAEAADGAEAVALTKKEHIDLAVLDVAMPTMTGLQAAREMSRRPSCPRILMLSMYDNEQYFFESLKAGASGYVLKSVADQDLLHACHAAMRRELYIYPGVISSLMRSHLDRLRRGETPPGNVLTAREDEVLKLIAEGHPSKSIATVLTISPKTVEHHRANILQKLGMRDRTDLTRYAIKAGLVEP